MLLTGDTPDEPVVHVYTASTTWSKPTAAAFSHILVEVQDDGGGGGNAVRTSFAGVTGSRPSYHAHGGGSFLGDMRRQHDMDAAGAAGRSYGGGGTGCSLNASTTGRAGGGGAAGVVIVTEYHLG